LKEECRSSGTVTVTKARQACPDAVDNRRGRRFARPLDQAGDPRPATSPSFRGDWPRALALTVMPRTRRTTGCAPCAMALAKRKRAVSRQTPPGRMHDP